MGCGLFCPATFSSGDIDFEPASISSSLFDLERLGSVFPEIVPNDNFRRTTSARFKDFGIS